MAHRSPGDPGRIAGSIAAALTALVAQALHGLMAAAPEVDQVARSTAFASQGLALRQYSAEA